VITIQTAMLVALGFLLAALLALALAPAFRRRTERLTMERMRQSMPMTEAEINADKDRLRAQFAIRVHKLEHEIEKFRLAAARQHVELNRRDAAIASLESDVQRLNSEHQEDANARRVLEHTISDRLPKLEQRLAEARKLIQQRDREMLSLSSEATRSIRTLDEAMQANAQQRAEIDRLMAAAATRPLGRHGEMGIERAGSAAETTGAERQISALREKVEDQATEITRLKAALSAYEPDQSEARGGRTAASKARLYALQAEVASQTETIRRLRIEIAAGNERLARQAAGHVQEMRRLGALPMQAQPRRGGQMPAKRSLAERIGQVNRPAPVQVGSHKKQAGSNGPAAGAATDAADGGGKVTEFLKALSEPEATDTAAAPQASAEAMLTGSDQEAAKPKPRLMDRLTGLAKG